MRITTDIAEPDQVANLVDTTVDRFGKLDVLVNNAAIVPFTAWDDIDFDEWRRLIRVNLDGTFLMCRAGSDAMRRSEYGRIVNICSNSILAGTPNMAHYEASKGGVMALTRALATELGGYGITVNSVAPGLDQQREHRRQPACQCLRLRGLAAGSEASGDIRGHRSCRGLPRVRGGRLDHRSDARGGRGHGALLAERSARRQACRSSGSRGSGRSWPWPTWSVRSRSTATHFGFIVEARYDDPPYATFIRNGVRLSFAEQGHPAEDRPGVAMVAPEDRSRLPVVLVLEVTDAAAVHRALVAEGVENLAEPFAPPWAGLRFFVVDPDGFLVEIEQPA